MKMSKKDRRRLERILEQLKTGQSFLLSSETLVCRIKKEKTTTIDFENKQGKVCYEINKEIGSKLTLLHNGVHELQKLLEEK
jgi:hypothetical protein